MTKKFWSTGVDKSVDFRIYAENRVKNELFWRLWQIHGAFLLCGWWMGDKHVKTHPNDVFSCGPTPVFISSAVMEKSIFENFGKWPFWGIFWPFLLYFGLKCVTNVFLPIFCVETGRIIYFKVTRYETDVMITIYYSRSLETIWICWPNCWLNVALSFREIRTNQVESNCIIARWIWNFCTKGYL